MMSGDAISHAAASAGLSSSRRSSRSQTRVGEGVAIQSGNGGTFRRQGKGKRAKENRRLLGDSGRFEVRPGTGVSRCPTYADYCGAAGSVAGGSAAGGVAAGGSAAG